MKVRIVQTDASTYVAEVNSPTNKRKTLRGAEQKTSGEALASLIRLHEKAFGIEEIGSFVTMKRAKYW